MKRQAEIDYEKAERALAQAKVDYMTKTEQARRRCAEVGADLRRQQNKLTIVQDVMGNFTIRAPVARHGDLREGVERQEEGRSARRSAPWDPTVATLPDLAQMESLTYVNEIDVRKIAVGPEGA